MRDLKIRKIKVCQVTTIPFAIRFLLLNQIKNLQKQDYDVSVVCSSGKWIKEIEQENISVKPITMTRKMSPFLDLISLFRLIIYFNKEKFDIIHTSTPKAGLLGTLAAKICGVPIIIHSNLGFYFHKGTPWLKKKFFIFIEKIVAKCSDLIFSVDREDIDTAIKKKICPPGKIKYLGGWVDLNRFNRYRFSQEFIEKKKQKLGISLDVKIIGIIARLVEEKGYLELFEAFTRVLKHFPNTILLIIGPKEPEKKDRINPALVFEQSKIKNNVLYLGERTDVDELYILMDVFVLPSWREGIGVSILEASAMEKPVIASNIRGLREAVENGKTGILIPVRDLEKLTQAILYLLSNPEKGKEMGRAGRKKIEKEFDQEIIFNRINKEYQRLISQKLS